MKNTPLYGIQFDISLANHVLCVQSTGKSVICLQATHKSVGFTKVQESTVSF